jgi:ABC-type polysaccharide/polyol phosphate export permease
MASTDLAYTWRLFTALTWTNFKMRYYGSILGYIWSLLKPLSLFGVIYLVFTVMMKQSGPHHGLFILLGIILWEYFSQATGAGMMGLIGNYQMIRKVSMPRIVLIASAVTSAFIGLLFNLVVFFIFACFDGIGWHLKMLWFVPILSALYLLTLGIGLILSIIVVKVRDMISLWEVAIQLGFWVTPIVYPMSFVPEKFRFFIFLNPMSGIISYARYFLIGIGEVTKIGCCYVFTISFLIFALGVLVFKWNEADMVEDL